METLYDKVNDCYRVYVKIKIGERWCYLKAVLDTGATHTVIALGELVRKSEVLKSSEKFDAYAREKGIKQVRIKGATVDSDIRKTYAYDACFDNVFVGGHLMRKFHARVMINGASNISVIGNDFLNMCKYYHNAGEYQLTVENPIEQKYYASFSGSKVLSNECLNVLFSSIEEERDACSMLDNFLKEEEAKMMEAGRKLLDS